MARKHARNQSMTQQTKDQPTHQEDPLMSTGDVARALGKHPATVLRWIQDGLLPYVRIQGRFSVRKSEVNKLLAGSAIQARVE